VNSGKKPSILTVVSALIRLARTLPEYTLKTSNLSHDAIALRRALLDSTEPDILLFNDIPHSFGIDEFEPGAKKSGEEISRFVERVVAAANELRTTYPSLLSSITKSLLDLAGGDPKSAQFRLRDLAEGVISHIADPRLRSLCVALRADLPDLEDWVKYVGMNVVGKPPEGWADSDQRRFASEIVELGGALQRLAAMHVQLPVGADGKSYYRQLLTRSDGSEVAFVVELTDEQRVTLTAQAESLLSTATETLDLDLATVRKMMTVIFSDVDGSQSPPTVTAST
jgi:hypothetical protein